MARKGERERRITGLFLDCAEELLFLHPRAQDCGELNSPGRIPWCQGKAAADGFARIFLSTAPRPS